MTIAGAYYAYDAVQQEKVAPEIKPLSEGNAQTQLNPVATQELSFKSDPIVSPEQPAHFDLSNPAQYALQAKDYEGSTAYGAAMLARVCANYFESRGNQDQDLADAATLERSGGKDFEGLVAMTAFKIRAMEVQCSGITSEDIKNSGNLMREAAAAGDINAKGIVLLDDFHSADAVRLDAKLANNGSEVDSATYKTWLGEATNLAEQGNLNGAQLAALLTGVNTYGQKDIASSAMWSIVAQQTKGEDFDSSKFSFDTAPYDQLSNAERSAVIERAKRSYVACCGTSATQDSAASSRK